MVRCEIQSPCSSANRDPEVGSELVSASVLLVDDDEDIREILGDILASAGCSYAGAGNGAEALELLMRVKPRLILLDPNMPVMDGIQFRECQQRDPAIASIPTVVMSAVDRMKVRISQMAVERVLDKPVDLKSMLDLVQQYCGPPARR
jgi:CheY-like chemotaxis protein